MVRRQKGERWGPPYRDTRDWKVYNKQLVNRGRLLVSVDFFKTWTRDLERLNHEKEGRPFTYPDNLFAFLAYVKIRLRLDYRSLEGYLHGLWDLVHPQLLANGFTPDEVAKFGVPSFSQIRRRVIKVKIPQRTRQRLDADQECDIILDATGIKVTNRGQWIRKHAQNRQNRGWIKIHLAMEDQEGTAAALQVTTDKVGDNRRHDALAKSGHRAIEKRGGTARKLYADSAYDTRSTFNTCKELGLQPVVNIKSNAVGKSPGSRARRAQVRQYQELGYREWSRQHGYGRRWLVEAKFGAVKRLTGEYVLSRTWPAMHKEVRLKMWAHDVMLDHDRARPPPWVP